MKTFVMLLTKKRNLTAEVVAQHVAHLKKLDGDDKLVLAGPFVGSTQGMVVFQAEDEALARKIAEQDPFVAEDVESFTPEELKVANKEKHYL